MQKTKNITIDFDKIRDIAFRGIRRTSVFMGLGVNAARDKRLKNYQLQDLVMFRVIPDNAGEQTIANFKAEFHRWIISNGLRELVETYATYLDKIYSFCILIRRSNREITNKELKKFSVTFEKQGLESKFKNLKKEFSITTTREKYVKNINRIRNCITHRQGKVSTEDLRGKDVLRLVWLGMECYAETPKGKKHSLMPPFPKNSVILKEGSNVMIHCVDRIREYKLGDHITFSPNDLGEICLVFHMATDDIAKSALDYAKSMGIEIMKK